LKTYYHTRSGIVRALDGVDLEIKQGEIVGVVGESGCGKSTLGRSILRLVPPGKIVDGQIFFKSRDIVRIPERELRSIRGQEISIIFQDPMTYLDPLKKVGEQIAEVIRLHKKIEKKDAKLRAIELLKDVGIPSPESIAGSYPHQLSGGMRQRVIIAMAISCKPSLIVADEPTSALDVTTQAQILDLFRDLMKELGSFILITHDLGIVAEICNRVSILYAGNNVEDANILKLFKNPLHPYTRGLMASTMSIEEFKKELVTIPGTVPDLTNPPQGCRFHPRCQYAEPICCKKPPPKIQVEKDHIVWCWLYA
jgi:oligopeptide/dipeptide ABC transporter ATP-binding protein